MGIWPLALRRFGGGEEVEDGFGIDWRTLGSGNVGSWDIGGVGGDNIGSGGNESGTLGGIAGD